MAQWSTGHGGLILRKFKFTAEPQEPICKPTDPTQPTHPPPPRPAPPSPAPLHPLETHPRVKSPSHSTWLPSGNFHASLSARTTTTAWALPSGGRPSLPPTSPAGTTCRGSRWTAWTCWPPRRWVPVFGGVRCVECLGEGEGGGEASAGREKGDSKCIAVSICSGPCLGGCAIPLSMPHIHAPLPQSSVLAFAPTHPPTCRLLPLPVSTCCATAP
jgi:hypothetical protein